MIYIDFFLVILGGLIGVIFTLIFWWYQNHVLIPKIKFCEEIARYPDSKNDGIYRVIFRNEGHRKIIDIKVVVRVSIFKLGSNSMWTNFNLLHNAEFVPALGKSGNKIVNVFDPNRGICPEHVLTKYSSEKIEGVRNLHDLLQLGEKAKLRVYVFGYDEFSGTRKIFRSKKYTKNDIRSGVFRNMNIVAPNY